MERDAMESALSNDLVLDIVLTHLKVIDLLSCRLASKFWNKTASSVLRNRSTMIKKISNKKCLMELGKCMKKSADFPFAGLKFDKPWTFSSGRAIKFFEDYGARFTRLFLDIHCTRSLDVMAPFIHRLSRLSVLEMNPHQSFTPHPHLKFSNSKAQLDRGEVLNLSSLRTLRIRCPIVDEEVLHEVLMAASSSSLQIECLNATHEALRALERAGRLRAVSFIKFDQDSGNWLHKSEMEKLMSTDPPSLTKLDCNVPASLTLDGLEKILFSSQHTLKEFHLSGKYMARSLGRLWNQFPVLTKLTTLSLHVRVDFCLQYLFQGRHGHNFPALKEFKLYDKFYSYDDPVDSFSNSLFIVPSVTRIGLQVYTSEHAMKQLAQVFPNVTDIQLEYGRYYSNDILSERVQSKIWSVGAFKCLERLRIWNYKVEKPRKHLISMDSFLTGIPVEICNNLRKYEQLNLIESPCNELSRDNASVLHLKNLKELIVCVKLDDRLTELPQDPPFMSMISMWYALDMMPKLRTTFTYEVTSRSSDEERYKRVLEAALKHVRPYVTLEPFFY